MDRQNLSMLMDFYELTMGNGYYKTGLSQKITYFDVFFRNVPDGCGFAIAAGLEQVVEYIQQLHFTQEDLAYLEGKRMFDRGFLIICAPFALPEIFMQCRKELRYFPMSRS